MKDGEARLKLKEQDEQIRKLYHLMDGQRDQHEKDLAALYKLVEKLGETAGYKVVTDEDGKSRWVRIIYGDYSHNA